MLIIALCFLLYFGVGYKIYKDVMAPVKWKHDNVHAGAFRVLFTLIAWPLIASVYYGCMAALSVMKMKEELAKPGDF
jgi:hypothetical protein